MLIIVILLLAVKLFFLIRNIPFEIQFNLLLQSLGVIVVVSLILRVVLKIITYDKEWEEDYEKRYGKSKEPSTFFDGWLHINDEKPFMWGIVYIIAVIIIFSCIIYNISKGESYLKVLGISAIPMILYDIVLMIDFKNNYAQSKFKLPFPHVWYFEVICCLIILAILAFIALIIAMIIGSTIIILIMTACPVLWIVWTLKD